ncbi:MAG: NAD(P)H-hydrate dehydratase [candidate division WOR-3 bacterium]|nr:NAD(P)H-hydrate dehydratase [candidate division WOR-3 bacterium]MDW7987136.1 NAD(P)H-hydrate dehydratase [candidate division WOR-3 bacterium]
MIPIVKNEEMHKLDLLVEKKIKLPLLLLMENAGREVCERVVSVINQEHISYPKILIVCGPGNNGGDGIVCARHLLNRLRLCEITLLILKTKSYSKDSFVNYQVIKELSKYDDRLKIVENDIRKIKKFKPDIIVDAIFGTGFTRKPEGIFRNAIDLINKTSCYKIAVDIASGVNGNSGEVIGPGVKAHKTVTMGLLKPGLILYPGKSYCQDVDIANLGIDYKKLFSPTTFLVELQDIKMIFPKRPPNGHKGHFGSVLVIAGGNGYSGAACLCSLAALKIGAGIVRLAFPETLRGIIEKRINEVIKIPLPATDEGSISLAGYPIIAEYAQKSSIIALGPGLTTNFETKCLVQKIIKTVDLPMVIDADGINNLSMEFLNSLPLRKRKMLILTPHPGEFERLFKVNAREVNRNRIEIVRAWAKRFSITLVLKGRPTVIGTPKGLVFVNPTGNSGLAKGGSGDVLTGMIAGFLAQGATILDSCLLGVYLHGFCADMGVKDKTEYSLLPSDLIKLIPNVIKKIIES